MEYLPFHYHLKCAALQYKQHKYEYSKGGI